MTRNINGQCSLSSRSSALSRPHSKQPSLFPFRRSNLFSTVPSSSHIFQHTTAPWHPVSWPAVSHRDGLLHKRPQYYYARKLVLFHQDHCSHHWHRHNNSHIIYQQPGFPRLRKKPRKTPTRRKRKRQKSQRITKKANPSKKPSIDFRETREQAVPRRPISKGSSPVSGRT